MSRALLISLTTLIILCGVYGIFVWRAQPRLAEGGVPATQDTPTGVMPSSGVVGPGKRPSWSDIENGRLASEFNADDYIPQKDGSFRVANPIYTAYLADGQQLKVTGDTGVINTDPPPKNSPTMFGGMNSSPRTGWLHRVRIELYHDAAATRPTLWMETENIHFDNDTLRIFTESYVDPATGQTVAADQVPVTMRGDDYEFDGNGLTIWWNGKNRRLQRLEVYHGKRLEIKNPSKLSLPGMSPAEPATKVAMDLSRPRPHPAGEPENRYTKGRSPLPPAAPRAEVSSIINQGNQPLGLSLEGFQRFVACKPRLADPSENHSSSIGSLSWPPDALASTDSSAASMVHADQLMPVADSTLYRAVFNDNVEITEGSTSAATPVRTLAIADLMLVDFLQGTNKTPATGAASQETPQETPALKNYPGSPAIPQTADLARSSEPAPSTVPEPASVSVKPPATRPVNGPVTITWTGKLLVTPLETEPMLPIAPGQSVVKLIGSPVKLTPEGATLVAGSALYRSPDGAVQLHAAAGSSVELTRDGGMTLSTGSIDYDPPTQLATLLGKSRLQVPVGNDKMVCTWNRQGILHMLKPAGQQQPSGVDQIDLTGNVDVRHPQFSLDSQTLQLTLASSSVSKDSEQLKLLIATGAPGDLVKCRLNDAGKPDTRGVDSDKLTIRTGQFRNQTVAREVIAEGDVRAFDPEQSLTAGSLDAMLLPRQAAAPATHPAAATAGPSVTPGIATGAATGANLSVAPGVTPTATPDAATAVDLESLHAATHVHAVLKSGATADSDDLKIAGIGKQQTLDLTGPSGAELTDGKGSWLKGPAIHMVPDGSVVAVHGPGSMETIRNPEPAPDDVDAAPPKTMDVSWTDSLSMDGSANSVDVFGHVQASNVDALGTISTLTGDLAHLDLQDGPRPSTRPSTTEPAPDSVASATGGKQLRKLTMSGHVLGSSDLLAADKQVIRQGRLHCDRLFYTPGNGTAEIPGPGKMYVENHLGDQKESAGAQGAMAISWQKQLLYSDSAHTITFTGDTVVGFLQDAKEAKSPRPPVEQTPMQLRSDQVVVTLASPPPAGKGKPERPGEQKTQVSQMQAIGNVRFNARGAELTSASADYDPATSILKARGTEKQPVEVLSGNMTGSFDYVEYDSLKQEVTRATGSHIKAAR